MFNPNLGNTLAFTTAATERMRIDSAGNVGIGTTAPQKKLHIEGTGAASEMQILVSSGSDTVGHTAGIGLRAEGGEADSALRIKGAIFFEREAGSFGTGKMHLAVNGAQTNNSVTLAEAALTIDDDRNVGIGTTAPVTPLTVAGGLLVRTTTADSYENRFQVVPGGAADAANVYVYDGAAAAKVRLNAGGDSYFNGGNVGIGTTSPSSALNVGTSGNTEITIGDASANAQGRLRFLTSNNQKNFQIGFNYNVGGGLEFTRSTAVGGSTFSTPDMVIQGSTGNVGNRNWTTSPSSYKFKNSRCC